MKNIIVTGANGQLGNEIRELASSLKGYQFHFTDYQELDITDAAAVEASFKALQPVFVINCAAYTAVDKAEEDQEKAYAINAEAVHTIATCCRRYNCQLIHISSDYVYHNGLNRPLLESDPTLPKGVYAASKLRGDMVALAADPSTIIVRTSWVYSSFGHNFIKTMIRLGNERDQLGIVYDQIGVPTSAKDIALAIISIMKKVEKEGQQFGGVYNFAPQGVTCWYDFAKTIFEIEGIDCNVNSIPSKAYPTPAKRPTYSVLDCTKIKETFGLEIPYWKDSVRSCLRVLKEQITATAN